MPKKTWSLPLLTWVVLALVLVGLLPFAISSYHIRSSRIAMVDQVQTLHLTAARSTAAQVEAYLESMTAIGIAALRNPDLYTDPSSTRAEEVLASLPQARSEILAAGVYLVDREPPELVRIARQAEHREAVARWLQVDDPAPLIAGKGIGPEGGSQLRIRLRLPFSDERLALFLVVDGEPLIRTLVAVELGDEAEVVLADSDGEVLAGAVGSLAGFPAQLLAQADAGLARSGAGEFRVDGGERLVAAWADVAASPWTVLSRQPARIAETASRQMRKTSWYAFTATMALTALLSLAANFSIVRPLRRLLRAQRQLAGIEGSAKGGEIAQLRESLALIERNLHDREALSRVFLDRYQIIDVLGAGAMGTVFRAWDPKLQRHVALKTLKIGEELDEGKRDEFAERLVKEAVTLAKIQHPNIVTVFDVVHQGDAAFIAMELVDGISLEQYLARRIKLPPSQAVTLGIALLNALDVSHREGFVHHDVKPANVLLGDDGAIKVTDFGVSELLTSANLHRGVVCGTPGYLAPEAILRRGYTEKSDLFAAGVVLYECLTGRLPFRGSNLREIVVATASAPVVPPGDLVSGIPPEVEEVVLSLLAKDPNDRPAAASEAVEPLERLAAENGWRWSAEPPERLESREKTDETVRLSTSLVPTLDGDRLGEL
ncbi:MAG: serine/threonine protein kinase [Thermoanaerobaculia bacterium]